MKSTKIGYYVRSINSSVKKHIKKHVKELSVNQGQMEYFLLIYNEPGISQLEIAELRNVGKSAVTKALKILESDALISRIPDDNDKRIHHCFVTSSGKKHVKDLLEIKSTMDLKLFDGFIEDEINQFEKYLERLYNNVKKMED